jgi:glycosyltransferase involved in cell wall biosynthesis
MVAPLVSIIIPVLNGERFLAEALRSALGQDYEPLEVIVVDDGSHDASLRIAQSFPSVRCVSQPHGGPAKARNRGIHLAAGEFLGFLDHDDRIPKTKVRIQVEYLMTHPTVDCVLGRMKTFVERGVVIPPWAGSHLDAEGIEWTALASALVRREAFDRSGGFEERYQVHSDHEWLFRLREAGCEIAVLPDVVYHRRIHTSNLTHQAESGSRWMLEALKDSLDRRRR